MPLIPFPDIPAYPGVPSLPRSPLFPPAVKVALGAVQGALLRAFTDQGNQWGIYSASGAPIFNPSRGAGILATFLSSVGSATLSTNSVEYGKEMSISDFPIEKGSFASYNKVERPAMPAVTFYLQGSEGDRRLFLDAVDKACKSTDLYSVVTPEVKYLGYSIESYKYARHNHKGATLLAVDIVLKEIRQVSAQYTQSTQTQISAPKDPAAAPQVDTGKVQSPIPNVSTLKSLATKIPSLSDITTGLQRLVPQF